MNTIINTLNGIFAYNYWLFVLAFAISFAIVAVLVPVIIKFSKRKGWLDLPNQRKVHKQPVPRFGGVAIYAGLIIVSLGVSVAFVNYQLLPLMLAVSLIFILGIVDDRFGLSAILKFAVQIAVAFLIAFLGYRIATLHGFLGVYQLATPVQYILTIVVLVGLVNAYNLIDGVDGLAGGLALINSVVFSILFLHAHQILYALFSIVLSGSLLGFLKYNIHNAKIFMGDGGSLVLGFSMAFLGIVFFNLPSQSIGINSLNQYMLVFALMLIPAYDTLRVFTERILSGKSPFVADKNHIHHLLLKTGFNSIKVVVVLSLANLLLMALSFMFYGKLLKYGFVYLFVASGFLSELITFYWWLKNVQEQKKCSANISRYKEKNYILYKHLIEKL